LEQLAAYVVPRLISGRRQDGLDLDVLEKRRVAEWAALYEKNYSEKLPADVELDFAGWNSSITGEPIPADEMRQWVNRTVERIVAHHPKRVLEIGCGSGLLLLRIAPTCETYCGTDFSQAVLNRVANAAAQHGLQGVRLAKQTADDLIGFESEVFDTVIINSVVQYLPSVDYLVRVLEGAVRRTAPGGIVFVGDVRSLPLIEAFHLGRNFIESSPLCRRESCGSG
jgi:2-polyprenyl-3-methyl-5-hydroxy-6-metoxy-1,4-benzoquinol methylase